MLLLLKERMLGALTEQEIMAQINQLENEVNSFFKTVQPAAVNPSEENAVAENPSTGFSIYHTLRSEWGRYNREFLNELSVDERTRARAVFYKGAELTARLANQLMSSVPGEKFFTELEQLENEIRAFFTELHLPFDPEERTFDSEWEKASQELATGVTDRMRHWMKISFYGGGLATFKLLIWMARRISAKPRVEDDTLERMELELREFLLRGTNGSRSTGDPDRNYECGWQEFSQAIVHTNFGETDRRTLKVCFYAGAWAFNRLHLKQAENLTRLSNELGEFLEQERILSPEARESLDLSRLSTFEEEMDTVLKQTQRTAGTNDQLLSEKLQAVENVVYSGGMAMLFLLKRTVCDEMRNNAACAEIDRLEDDLQRLCTQKLSGGSHRREVGKRLADENPILNAFLAEWKKFATDIDDAEGIEGCFLRGGVIMVGLFKDLYHRRMGPEIRAAEIEKLERRGREFFEKLGIDPAAMFTTTT
jgi:hypothetical protein